MKIQLLTYNKFFLLLFFFLISYTNICYSKSSLISVFVSPLNLSTLDPYYLNINKLKYINGFELTSSDNKFGGLSGLYINDLNHFYSISDHGYWFKAKLQLNENGYLESLSDFHMGFLKNSFNRLLKKELNNTDAEAIEYLNNGSFLISFERNHRILRYNNLDEFSEVFLPNGTISNLPNNGGLEAISLLKDRSLFMIAEDKILPNGNLEAYIFKNGKIEYLTFKKNGSFKPTDLSTLPSGDLLLLERSFTPIRGVEARISVIKKSSLTSKGLIDSIPLGKLSAPLLVDNFEGISYIKRKDGSFAILIISDDNYKFIQRTLLLQFHWDGKY